MRARYKRFLIFMVLPGIWMYTTILLKPVNYAYSIWALPWAFSVVLPGVIMAFYVSYLLHDPVYRAISKIRPFLEWVNKD